MAMERRRDPHNIAAKQATPYMVEKRACPRHVLHMLAGLLKIGRISRLADNLRVASLMLFADTSTSRDHRCQ